MEGRGTSRRRNPFKIWKRRISAVLALVMTAGLVLNAPLSLADFGFRISDVYASGSNAERRDSTWATASNAKYKQGESQEVDIYVIAEDNEAVPDNSTFLTLYLRNNTGQMITEGSLTFKGNHIAQKDGYFQDMGTTEGDSPVIVVDGGETGAAQDVQKPAAESSGEGMIYQEPETGITVQDPELLPEEEAQPDAENLPDEFGTEESEEIQDDEDEDENDAYELIGIDLQPGEMREIQFEFYTDEEEDSTKAYVEFTFRGDKEDGSRIKSDSKFYYSIGLPFVDLSLEEGMKIESGVSNDMEIWMNEPTWVDENLEERIEAREEKEAEEEYEALEEAEDVTIASGSDAEKEETASPSDANREETSQEQKDQEKIDQYVQEAMEISESKVSYEIEIYGAQFERFSPRKAEEAEGLGWISCVYEVANHTAPGLYYGKVRANGRWNNEKFTSEQGFFFEVTGTAYPAQTFTADTEDIQVTVTAEEGILPKDAKLNVTKLTPDNEETARQYKEAEEAMAAEGTQYDGMLALDITFQDEDGNEIEPNGNVQVSIEMKETEIAAGVSPESIEVHHLKENQQGDETEIQVEKVADGADETAGTVEMKEAGTEAAVVAVEFEVESFSTFVVTYGGETLRLKNVILVDEEGYVLPNTDNMSLRITLSSQEMKFADIIRGTGFEKITRNNTSYFYKEVYVDDILCVNISHYGKWQCKRAVGVEGSTNEEQFYINVNESTPIRLVYSGSSGPDQREKISTVDNVEAGIQLNLFNYNGRINGGSSAEELDENIKRALTFANDGEGKDGSLSKSNSHLLSADKYQDGELAQGIVDNTLHDGFPYVSTSDKNRPRSLDYLFGGNNDWNEAIEAYSGANYLFTKDDDGYYEYNSAEHAADFDTETKQFTVWNYTEGPAGETKGSFLPFNSYGDENSDAFWITVEDGYQYSYPEENVDYWFGMTIETSFIQPLEGRVSDEPMVFEFTGDDDVWVFIDDVLVLDLGGIHSAVSGSINFATGEVIVKDTEENTSSKTIRSCFEEAEKIDLDNIFEEDGTFKDYSTHVMKYYYLERGGDVANCHIKFNLQTIPKESVAVGKQVEIQNNGANAEITDDTVYQFRLEKLDESGNGVAVSGKEYSIYSLNADGTIDFSNLGDSLGSDTTGDNGIFTFKKNQFAFFSDLLDGKESYRVTELVTEGTELADNLDSIKVNGETASSIYSASTELDRENQYALFQNILKDTTSEIVVKKVWVDDNNTANTRPESVTMQVFWREAEVEEGADEPKWKVYPDEEQPLTLVLNGTKDADTETSQTAETAAWEGVIRGLPEYVTVSQNGTTKQIKAEYTVFELSSNGEKIDAGGGLPGLGESQYVVSYESEGSKGAMLITVTNTLASELVINKIDEDTKQPINGAQFKLEVLSDDSETWNVVKENISTTSDGKITFSYLLPGRYRLTETAPAPGYNMPDSPWIIVIGTDGVVRVENQEQHGNITVTGREITITNKMGVELPETGGPGIGQIKEFGWMLLFLAATMAGVEVQINRRRRSG